MILTIAIFSFFLCSVQGNGAYPENELEAKQYLAEHKIFLDGMKEWLSDMSKNMRTQVETTTHEFQKVPDTLIEDGKAQLALHYAHTMQLVMTSSAPQHVMTASQEELSRLHANNLNSFLTCKNLTAGVKDIIGMGLEVSKLTVQILLTADEVLNGFGDCASWNIFRFFYCTFHWVKDSLTQIYRSFEAVADFSKNIAFLTSDLKHQIEYCMHESKVTALKHHVQVLRKVQQCGAESR